MSEDGQADLRRELTRIARRVRSAVRQAIKDGSLHPEDVEHLRWTVENFQYSEHGITYDRASADRTTKPAWGTPLAVWTMRTARSEPYAKLSERLTREARDPTGSAFFLETFIREVANHQVNSIESGARRPPGTRLISQLLGRLMDQPVKCTAAVHLNGVLLCCAPIRIVVDGTSLELRATTVSDFVGERAIDPLAGPFLTFPTAVMSITITARNAADLQQHVNRSVALLRLFELGSVKYESYDMTSESPFTPHSGARMGGVGHMMSALEKYVLRDTGASRLRGFWRAISPHIDGAIDRAGSVSRKPLAIAYHRYEEALLRNGSEERRIANAVMGLEALYLTSDENQELGYRLKTRLARLMGPLGLDAHEVRSTVADAYTVRSVYVHGDALSGKSRGRIERVYGGFDSLLRRTLEYVRVGIIVSMLGGLSKAEVIKLIDDSLIDDPRAVEWRRMLAKVKPRLGGCTKAHAADTSQLS